MISSPNYDRKWKQKAISNRKQNEDENDGPTRVGGTVTQRQSPLSDVQAVTWPDLEKFSSENERRKRGDT